MQTERATIYQMLQQVRGMEPVIYDGEQTPERCIMSQLHPMAQMCYTAVPTSLDGNCLWHMVSLGLCGMEELMPDLRVLTLVTLEQTVLQAPAEQRGPRRNSCFVGSVGWKISPSCTVSCLEETNLHILFILRKRWRVLLCR